ncbi:transcriptional regulator [Thalassotalea insulae]|uniref:Transcriptional regulator n=2 Tax=Thalassotalea insulae TaxID=2056778 RepID=A0ABQ6GQY6_9GAMM|nr:transcriptional regulator [Thalassotalea insulae]
MTSKPTLTLSHFFPYQLTKLQASISESIAQIYTGKFNLSRQEWRVLATLADRAPQTAKQIGSEVNLDKMSASRAIQRMLSKQLLKRIENTSDKRSFLLELSVKGQQLYQQLEPLVLERETQLLSVLTPDEQQALNQMMAKLQAKASSITQ